jgi:hypothetical protein
LPKLLRNRGKKVLISLLPMGFMNENGMMLSCYLSFFLL